MKYFYRFNFKIIELVISWNHENNATPESLLSNCEYKIGISGASK